MFQIKFTQRGQKDFQKLNSKIQRFVSDKLLFYADQPNPLLFAKPLVNLPPATHRFRIRKYRASFFVADKTIFIERIEIRGRAYKH